MNYEIHTLYSSNINSEIIKYHKKVFDYFGIKVSYSNDDIHPGHFYNQIMEKTDKDVVIFCDIDAVILTPKAISDVLHYCGKNYLIGVTQVTPNHNSIHEFYCAPAFMGITKKYYNEIGSPSFMDEAKLNCDVGQQITQQAIKHRKRMKFWFPETFQGLHLGGIWRYSSWGYNGVGSIYDDKVYHLFQSRFSNNIQLFIETCEHILNDNQDKINRKYRCKDDYDLPVDTDYI